MIALIDGDLVCYRSAASCEPTKIKSYQEPLEIAVLRCDDMMNRILDETKVDSFSSFISGSENFRYAIDPDYKANRRNTPRPPHLEPIREHLVRFWNARISDGIEADDNLGIAQEKVPHLNSTIICSLDKDLLQVPGWHYNWVRQETRVITAHQGWVNFYTQLVMGDRSDNIKGYDGKMRTVVPKFLQPIIDRITSVRTPMEMYRIVADIYELGDEALHQNAQLLYIQRKVGDSWQKPE